MQDTTKHVLVTIGFIGIIMTVLIANILTQDKTVSITERRKLAQLPEITVDSLLEGKVAKQWESYTVDQFIARDWLRSIHAFSSRYLFGQQDTHQLFEKDGGIYSMEYPLKERNVQIAAEKMNHVYQQYLQGMDVYYAVIPDKNYYLENDSHLKMDYAALQTILQENLPHMQYIHIWDSLTLEDYYKTDLHWKQENLQDVVQTIQQEMQVTDTSDTVYNIEEKGDFYGAYYGQLGVAVPPDTLSIITNPTIENCVTYNYETKKTGEIYMAPTSADAYDTYLSGATPLIAIENPNANTDKELLLFRDSFGSSLAPWLVENYKNITLIDLRYMSSSLLPEYIQFHDQDVLFLYSTVILNQNAWK